MKKQNQHLYKAALYLRLSNQNLKEDSDESDSIGNQEALLRTFLKSHPDIEIKSVFKDDGWSGVNFDRPGFQKMMQKIYDGEIDCVVVKDLSRLGRNHTETGKYITRVFPAFGVRFIAANDHIDTADSTSDSDNIIIPFKDLLNDSYSRDISMKIRSARVVMNEAGEFSGQFKPYGYNVDPQDKNHYVIDPEAAAVVRKIYSWTFDGLGITEVANRLNRLHILCPIEYKRMKSGKTPTGKKWNVFQVYRTLRNDVYAGTLRLGKTTTPNYKVKKQIRIPKENQYVFPDAHEPIISKEEFALMQDVLSRDVRAHSGTKGDSKYAYVYPLTGFVYCADCGASMIIKTVRVEGHVYRYFLCGEHKQNKEICSSHTVPMEKMNAMVLKALNAHLKMLLKTEAMINDSNIGVLAQPRMEKLQIRIGQLLEKKYRLTECINGLRRDVDDGILTESEYQELKSDYEQQIEELSQDAAELEMEKQTALAKEIDNLKWVIDYKDRGTLTELTRREVVVFINRIEVKDEDHIRIRFRFGNEYREVWKALQEKGIYGKSSSGKGTSSKDISGKDTSGKGSFGKVSSGSAGQPVTGCTEMVKEAEA